jgi:excisionase family DNA binding protein
VADLEFLTPAQVAAEVHVTVVTVRRWINTGALRATRAGPRKWLVRRSDLDAFLSVGSGGGRVDVGGELSEDPSFRRYLVVPE